MPVQSCRRESRPGFKWGAQGFCYIHTAGDERGRRRARRLATLQGLAIGELESSPLAEQERPDVTPLGPEAPITRRARRESRSHLRRQLILERQVRAIYNKLANSLAKRLPARLTTETADTFARLVDRRVDTASARVARLLDRHGQAEVRAGINSGIRQAQLLEADLPRSPRLSGTERAAVRDRAFSLIRRGPDFASMEERIRRHAALTTRGLNRFLAANEGATRGQVSVRVKAFFRDPPNRNTKAFRRFMRENPPGAGWHRGMRENTVRALRGSSNRAFRAGVNSYAEQVGTFAPEVVPAVRWNLSAAHPDQDICDELATQDTGLGSGLYTPDAVPDQPHARCMCFTSVELVSA